MKQIENVSKRSGLDLERPCSAYRTPVTYMFYMRSASVAFRTSRRVLVMKQIENALKVFWRY